MHPFIAERRRELAEICRRYHVVRLELFGSATGDEFDPQSSDVDLIVEFAPLQGHDYTANYWAFQDAVERLFQRPIDIISASSELRNPYFREAVNRSRCLV